MRFWPSKKGDTKAHVWIHLLTQNTDNHDGDLMAKDKLVVPGACITIDNPGSDP